MEILGKVLIGTGAVVLYFGIMIAAAVGLTNIGTNGGNFWDYAIVAPAAVLVLAVLAGTIYMIGSVIVDEFF